MSPAGDPAGLRVAARGPVLLVTIDRPPVRNAVDAATAAAIAAAMDRLDADPALVVGILTGAGGMFSAGADLKALPGPLPDRGNFGVCVRPPAKPLIAAIEGFALGGGLEIALACDLIVAARDARLGLPEVRHNLVAAGGGLFRLAQRIPYGIAMEMALSGAPRTAADLAPWGLINRLCDACEALDSALALAGDLLANGPTALAATVRIMRAARGQSDAAAWEVQRPIVAALRETADYAEGRRAFREGRPPVWRGA